jgi:hypothetical protein
VGRHFTVTVTHLDAFPARSTTRTQSLFFVVFTRTVREVAFGLPVATSEILPDADDFTWTLPIPEFLSLARTVRRTPPRAAATVTAPLEDEVAAPVAPVMAGAVVSRMMSSW